MHPNLFKDLYRPAKEFKFNSGDECLDYLETVKGTEQEGFVVMDSNFNRIKIKSKDYVRLHQLKDNLTVKGFLEVVRNNESDEFLTYFPEFSKEYQEIKNIILGGGHLLLSPERRFDAIIYNSPDLFN